MSETGKFGGSFPDVVYPARLCTPVLRKNRIKKWLRDNDVSIWGSYDGAVDEDDIIDLLLDFEKFLVAEELKK
jgi:hypothetical protein